MNTKEEVIEKKEVGELSNLNTLPNLHEANVSPRELSSEYWTPEESGEYKVGVIVETKEEPYEKEDNTVIMLPCVIMLAQDTKGNFNTIKNGSVRLVATILDAVQSGEVVFTKTPVKITFLGKKKNKTNSFSSDRWSVKPIIL